MLQSAAVWEASGKMLTREADSGDRLNRKVDRFKNEGVFN